MQERDDNHTCRVIICVLNSACAVLQISAHTIVVSRAESLKNSFSDFLQSSEYPLRHCQISITHIFIHWFLHGGQLSFLRFLFIRLISFSPVSVFSFQVQAKVFSYYFISNYNYIISNILVLKLSVVNFQFYLRACIFINF